MIYPVLVLPKLLYAFLIYASFFQKWFGGVSNNEICDLGNTSEDICISEDNFCK